MDEGGMIGCGSEGEVREGVGWEEKVVVWTSGMGAEVVEELKVEGGVRMVDV
ncbi:hypothetical protein [Paenibacillus xylanexedens]|uniref:hypothetical protein n=1 Tax=Paenibacillus xylanexedens TaxID=528191 RepID=UPI001642F756|nr:hypothetical protein [Paenibacillus xylanexedens]